ncbi:McrB family protein [Brachyspira murdochii]|uniref:McrB family protein n=1 Tax=Brachyspira murdochii TaxID=84378 RepID=UPI00300544B3
MAKEIMKDNTHIKDYKKFIIDYYKNNKERLERFKEETDKLLQEFQQKFPQNKLKEISIEKYSAGNINKDSFCYWIEFKLKELGYFFPGNASTYLIYYDKEKNKYLNKSDIEDNEELIKEIGNSIYSMSETINYNGKLTFKDRFESLSMKIYNSYNPYYYFPIYHKKRMDGICNIFNIPIDNNIYRENLNLKKFFDDNFNIDSVIILKILNENQDLKNISNTEYNYRFVQFHPSYDYTDFVEGLRPIKDSNGNIMFERKDGVFKEFCKNALQNRSSKFVFIIDEINRGEISKIFGELFFAIDTGYRGEIERVKTQYNNLISNDETDDEFEDGFFVPENVYIIGTMNDIDRSVESMDFAMRRRFAWKEIKAKDTQYMLDNVLDNGILDEAKDRMNKLNEAIEKIEGFNSSYHIGASYFLKLKNYYDNSIDNKEEAFNNSWENHLKGLLYEYLRGMPDAENKLDELKSAYYLNDDN